MNHSRTPNPVDVYVAQRITERRKAMKITTQALADKIGTSYQQTYKYASGETRISAGTLYKIGTVLGVKPGWFFEGIEV